MEFRQQVTTYPFLKGGGEMGERTRSFDWSNTSLGSPEMWPQSLKTTVSNLLRSRFPMFLWWGPDMIQFYNDAYRPSLGEEGKHPGALGGKGKDTWPEIWGVIFPLMQHVVNTGEGTWMENQLIPILRNGRLEDVYWTYSYSSVLNDDGVHGGILVTCMETTELVKGQTDLQQSDKRLRNMIEQAPVGIAITRGAQMTFESINPPMLSIITKSKDEVIGKKVAEVLPELQRQPVFNTLQHVHETGETYNGSEVPITLMKNAALQTGYFNLSYTRIVEEGGTPAILHMAFDVTQQVHARRKLEESEAKYRMLFDSMDQGYCTLKLIFNQAGKCVDYRYLETNPTFDRHLGMSGALGKTIREIAPDIEPKWFEFYSSVVLTGVPIRIEEESKAFNKWFEIYAVRVGTAEEQKVGVFFTDVTSRKNSEKSLKNNEVLLRTVFDSAPNSLTVYEEIYNDEGAVADFKFIIVNQFTIQTTGRADLIGKLYSVEFPNVRDSGVLDTFIEVATTGVPADFERWYAGEGMRHWFRFIVSKVGKLLVVTTEDITKRKETEKAIVESEAKLRSILNSAPTAIGVFVGPDLILENPNQLMIEVMAAGPDIVGKSFRKLLSGLVEGEQKFLHIIDEVRATGEPFEAKEAEVFFLAEKRNRYFNINFIPLRDESGQVYAVLDVSVDVTDQVLTRKKIEESEGRFRLLADASPNLIWMLQADGSYGYVNTTTLNFLGITQEEIAEAGWVPYQHPEDVEPVTQAIMEAIASQQPYEREHRLRHKDGAYRWVLSQAIPAYDENGHVFAYVGSSIDIDEARKSRQGLQRALEQVRLSKEAASLGTFDLDLQQGSMHWDDRCRTLFGISHQQPVSYDIDFIQGLHPDDRQRILQAIDLAFDKSVTNGDYDVEYRTVGAEDGQLRWVRAKGKVYFDALGNPERFIGSVLDITEQVLAIQKIEHLVEERTRELALANESLLQANRELKRSNQNLEEFAHAASHDLKEPVRKILFFTHQLKAQLSEYLKDEQARAFSRIQNASERMGNLIDDLLLYSHVSQRPHEKESIDLKLKVQRVLEDLELDIQEKGAVIEVDMLPVVKGYRRQLQQLFQNLISNALKYSTSGVPPVIKITASQVTEGGRMYHVIAVADNGIGFEPEYADKIFQMFTRLHGKAEYSGTGVGLSIVKKVVENHDGLIKVESSLGQGSKFMIYLPVD